VVVVLCTDHCPWGNGCNSASLATGSHIWTYEWHSPSKCKEDKFLIYNFTIQIYYVCKLALKLKLFGKSFFCRNYLPVVRIGKEIGTVEWACPVEEGKLGQTKNREKAGRK
jgi:hypothetical protein